jgi:hypothetical protein
VRKAGNTLGPPPYFFAVEGVHRQTSMTKIFVSAGKKENTSFLYFQVKEKPYCL